MGRNAGWSSGASGKRTLSQVERTKLASYMVIILLALLLATVVGGIFGPRLMGTGGQGAQSARIFELRVTEMDGRLIAASMKSPYPGRPNRLVLSYTLRSANQAGGGDSVKARQALLLAVCNETELTAVGCITELYDDRAVHTYRLIHR